jgi:hypothetical protein
MKWINWWILIQLVLVASVAVAETPTQSITVDCNNGQSLNGTLSKLDKQTPSVVSVNGTCTEYVQVIGFENLTLKGLAGATLLQPTTGAGNLFNSLLFIESSLRYRGWVQHPGGHGDRSGSRDRSWQQRHPLAALEYTGRHRWNLRF